MISLLLLIAQRGIHRASAVIGMLAVATGVGLTAAVIGWPASTDTALLVAASLTGVAVVVARPLPRVLVLALAAGIGLGIGLGSDPEGLRGASRYANLAGTWFGTCLYAISGATLLDEFKCPWIPVLIRVLGAWMVATSVLVLALHTVAPPATLHGGAASQPLGR